MAEQVTVTVYDPINRQCVNIEFDEAQSETVAEWRAHMAAQFMGAAWHNAMTRLERLGLSHEAAELALLETVDDLIENGVADYR